MTPAEREALTRLIERYGEACSQAAITFGDEGTLARTAIERLWAQIELALDSLEHTDAGR